jgi:3-phenylpropionate/trans-cinnamate dioxygenase ferredoxin subunit
MTDRPAPAPDRLMLCSLDELSPGTARRFDIDGHRLAAIRLGDDVYVIGDRCSHADYSLAEGEIDADELTIECWKHGSTFSLTTGEPTCFPATKPVPTYEAVVEDGMIQVVVS